MLSSLLLLLLPQSAIQQDGRRVMQVFGFPDFSHDLSSRTKSGGWSLMSHGIVLTLDSAGRPWQLRTPGTFETSREREAVAMLSPIPVQLGFKFPAGKWITDGEVYGRPTKGNGLSMRYVYVPVQRGFQFLDCALASARLTKDSKRVLEWGYYPRPIHSAPPIGVILNRGEALRAFHSHARNALRGQPPNRSYRINTQDLRIGWIHPGKPLLVYACMVRYLTKTSGGTRGSGGVERIDARTGALVP
jgi:hypothetical protein